LFDGCFTVAVIVESMRMSDSVPWPWKSRKAVCAVAYTVQDAASCLSELEVKAVLLSSHVMVVSNDLRIA
jgi:hypothetical protein